MSGLNPNPQDSSNVCISVSDPTSPTPESGAVCNPSGQCWSVCMKCKLYQFCFWKYIHPKPWKHKSNFAVSWKTHVLKFTTEVITSRSWDGKVQKGISIVLVLMLSGVYSSITFVTICKLRWMYLIYLCGHEQIIYSLILSFLNYT